MSPAEAIAMLDRRLAGGGTDVVLQRVTGGTTVAQAVTVRASVKEGAVQDLVNGVMQMLGIVIISPTTAAAFVSGAEAGLDPRIPVKGNRVVVSGRVRMVQSAFGKSIDGTLVRIEARILG